jgi:hypothetical protein
MPSVPRDLPLEDERRQRASISRRGFQTVPLTKPWNVERRETKKEYSRDLHHEVTFLFDVAVACVLRDD